MAFSAGGHRFEMTKGGIRCVLLDADCHLCDAAWHSVRNATHDDIGKRGIAHVGVLNQSELNEILKVRAEEEEAIWEAVIYAASAGSR
jgi:hypothetical protein